MAAPIAIALFGAQMPRYHPRVLPEPYGQTAKNTKLLDGSLVPWKSPSSIVTPSKVGTKLSIYRYGQDVTNEAQYWFHWTSDVDVAKAPLAGDTAEKTAWTGEAEPRITDSAIALLAGTDYPMNWYKLGVTVPANTPTAVLGGVGTGVAQNRSYVYTFVNSYGQEGPPSTLSSEVAWKEGNNVTVGNMSTSAGAGYNITAKRIYRTITGSNSVDFKFVAEVAAATVSYVDSIADSSLGESLPSTEWDAPPAGMLGLLVMPNGIAAGFLANELLLSEPYMIHAWPARYRKVSDWKIVGLGQFSKNVVIVTKGKPYIAGGTHPSAFSMDAVQVGVAGVSKRSIASVDKVGVCYAANTGLALIGNRGTGICTEGIMNPDDWEALVPSSMIGFPYNGKYFGFYNTGSVQQGFIVDPLNPDAGITFTDQFATAGYLDPIRDRLYLQIGSAIKKWDGDVTYLTATWKSRVIVPARPANFSFGQVHADAYPVTFKVYVDGALYCTRTVTSNKPFRISAAQEKRGREFEVEISSSAGRVKAAYMAESGAGLRAV